MPDFKGPAQNYCKYCTDEAGNLRSRQEVQQGVAHWFQTWQPDLDEKTATNRAAIYLKSMPAWADK
ncbi:MAG: hypothetical protein L0Y74_05015 [candidate division Zixibacteria bacterium]|nr:hypothetical protein [candidate division Zixibacteria bacterium]